MTSPIFVRCSRCDGLAVISVPGRGWKGKWDTDPPEYYAEEESCPQCDGTGREEVEGEPIEMEDLDQ